MKDGRFTDRRGRAVTFAIAILGVLLFAPSSPALAHETRTVGDIVVSVGWGNEPTYAGYQHPVEVFFAEAGGSEEEDGPPISDADVQVEVFFGAEASGASSVRLAMEEAFGDPGHFEADMIPTRPGTYTFRLTGTVAGQEIDEVFTSGPDTFSDVGLTASIQFPEQDPTNGELAERIARIDDRAGGSDTSLWIAIAAAVMALAALVASMRRRAQG